ncbi:unnamed protein product [Caenorhabditis sp. 36 PRJEB53466]|nr:unnamed protein product [Caenorhabditis sp. 36 PRJEB53466]
MWVFVKSLHPMEEINEVINNTRPELIGSNWTYYAVIELYSPSQIVFNFLSVWLTWIVLTVEDQQPSEYVHVFQQLETTSQICNLCALCSDIRPNSERVGGCLLCDSPRVQLVQHLSIRKSYGASHRTNEFCESDRHYCVHSSIS